MNPDLRANSHQSRSTANLCGSCNHVRTRLRNHFNHGLRTKHQFQSLLDLVVLRVSLQNDGRIAHYDVVLAISVKSKESICFYELIEFDKQLVK